MPGTLRVRNLAQKVLWEQELSGQISDGRWENSRPMNHWTPWCDAECVVDPDNVGRDFYAQRDGYCFTEKELLEIIGERMLGYVRDATGNAEYSHKDMLADLRDLRKILKLRVDATLLVPAQPSGHLGVTTADGFVESLMVYVPQPVVERSYTYADFLEV